MSDRKSQKKAARRSTSKSASKVDPAPKVNAQKVDIDRLFHSLGDPTRRAILDRLTRSPMSVSALAEPLGVTLTAVAQHLQVLEECALVRTEKVGRVRTCRIEPAGFDALEQWIADHRTVWEKRLNLLGTLLEDEDEEG